MEINDSPVAWLLDGDVSIQYQTHRDFVCGMAQRKLDALRARIATEGWGARFLAAQKPDGHWGGEFYVPKWTCTHYTLCDLANIGLAPGNAGVCTAIDMIFTQRIDDEKSVNYARTNLPSDVCINGMVLAFASHFREREDRPALLVDYLLKKQMKDGAWNCMLENGATHGSFHTTIAVLEGLGGYIAAGYNHRREEVKAARARGEEFLLVHKLCESHLTGKVFDPKMLMLSCPSRWRYDILRALDYFRAAGGKYDSRMDHALDVLLGKRAKNGTWPLQAKHPGRVHFDMEETGKPSRWNTLRALRVLRHFGIGAK